MRKIGRNRNIVTLVLTALTALGAAPAFGQSNPDLVETNIRNGKILSGVEGVVQPGPLRTGTDLSHGAGSDGDLQMGAGIRFTSSSNGTVFDHTTGLMWEKKTNDGSVHDWDNTYTWDGPGAGLKMDGTVVTQFLAELNSGSGFAGYKDWRLPNVNELLTLARYTAGDSGNKIDPAFVNINCPLGCTIANCSCTKLSNAWYMSSTSNQTSAAYMYGVDFSRPKMDWQLGGTAYVRAVRGGYSGCSQCATENGTCQVSGYQILRYGAAGKYVYEQVTGSVACNNATFGDPVYGVVKHCELCEAPVEVPLGNCCQGPDSCAVLPDILTLADCQARVGTVGSSFTTGACGIDGACSATPAPGGCCQVGANGCASGEIAGTQAACESHDGTWMPLSTCGGDGVCH